MKTTIFFIISSFLWLPSFGSYRIIVIPDNNDCVTCLIKINRITQKHFHNSFLLFKDSNQMNLVLKTEWANTVPRTNFLVNEVLYKKNNLGTTTLMILNDSSRIIYSVLGQKINELVEIQIDQIFGEKVEIGIKNRNTLPDNFKINRVKRYENKIFFDDFKRKQILVYLDKNIDTISLNNYFACAQSEVNKFIEKEEKDFSNTGIDKEKLLKTYVGERLSILNFSIDRSKMYVLFDLAFCSLSIDKDKLDSTITISRSQFIVINNEKGFNLIHLSKEKNADYELKYDVFEVFENNYYFSCNSFAKNSGDLEIGIVRLSFNKDGYLDRTNPKSVCKKPEIVSKYYHGQLDGVEQSGSLLYYVASPKIFDLSTEEEWEIEISDSFYYKKYFSAGNFDLMEYTQSFLTSDSRKISLGSGQFIYRFKGDFYLANYYLGKYVNSTILGSKLDYNYLFFNGFDKLIGISENQRTIDLLSIH